MDDEYLFKIALDATDFNAGVQAMRSLLGEMQDAIGGNVRAYTTLDKSITTFESTVTGAAAASKAMVAETRSMAEGFSGLMGELKGATDAYKTFREEQVVGSGSLGKDVTAYSVEALQKLVATYDASTASFITAARSRLKAEQEAADGIAAAHKAEAESLTILAGATERFNGLANSAQRRTVGNAYTVRPSDGSASEQQLAESQAALQQLGERYALMERVTSLRRTPTDGLVANSAARNTVGNAYTVQPAGGAPSEAELEASKQQLTQMADFYKAQEQENRLKAASVPLTDAQVAANARLAAAEDRTNAALSRHATGLQRTSTELPRLRYALYDISTTFTILGAGMAAYGAGITKVTTDYQTAFASVARTSKGLSQGELATLKSDLIGLSTQVPASFEDITKIATLGNQLNIPAKSLTGFTKTVTEFATAANVSTDVAATAFGRLGQIFKTQNYQGLGDQIAYLGVRAVATEADIIKVGQQIAVTTNAYGISEKNTLALATAYASLGVKAESARGTTVRFLADLQKAVVQGGAPLSEIATVTGMSTAAFSKLFSSDANAGMTAFLQGLAKYGRDGKSVLAELGITAQRDITNITLLAQNTNVLADAQKNATQAGGALDTMFKKQTDTVSAQLTLAGNKVKAIFNDIGTSASTPMRGAVDALNSLLDVLDKVSKDPIAVTALAISAAVVTLSGVALIGVGTMAQYAASILAVRTYMEAMGASSNSLRGIFTAVTGVTVGGTNANLAYAESLHAAASEEAVTAANVEALTASRRALNVQTQQAVVADAELNLELAKGAGVREGIIAQEIALAKAQADLNLALAQQGVVEAEAQLAAVRYSGAVDETTFATARLEAATLKLAEAQDAAAIASRTAALAQQEGALTGVAAAEEKAAASGSKLSSVLGKAGLVGGILALLPLIPIVIDSLRQMGDAANGTSVDVDTLTAKVLGLSNKASGAQNLADLVKALQAGNTDNPLSHIGDAIFAPFGQSFQGNNGHQYNAAQGAVNKITTGQTTPGTSISYGNGSMLFDKNVDAAISGYQKFDQAVSTSIAKGDLADAKTALAAFDKEMESSGVKSSVAEKILTATASALGVTKGQSLGAALASKQSGDAATKQARAFSTIVTAAFASGSAASAMQKDMAALGKSFVVNGAAATIGGGALKKVIEQIFADTGGGPAAAAEMQGLFDTLVKGGFASAAQLKPLADIIAQLTGGKKIASTAVDGADAMYSAYNKAAEAANKAGNSAAAATEKAARTLMDYGNDLSTVIGNMLSYQFGVGDASDKITQGWDQIKSDAASARDSVKSIRADLLALQATKATAQFALMVDSEYGDVTAAAQDRANLAKANSDIAAKSRDLKTAQDASSTSLVGNSEAAIKNRQALEGQISSVQGYVVALAESGASQKQIDAAIDKSKQQFIAQATQLGYNKTQVEKLATAFDGMKTVVDHIPRNITTNVTAKTSAAMKALADYQSAIKKTNGMSVTTPFHVEPKDPGKAIGETLMDGLRRTLGSQGAFDFIFQTPAGKKQREGSLILQANQGKSSPSSGGRKDPFGFPAYAGGGWTGNGGIFDPAGVVHGQEFVLNAIGAKMLPMADLVAMNQGRAPQSASPTIVVGGSGKSGGLTAQDKMFLAQVLSAKPSISLSADQFGKAIDGANVRANQRGAG